MKGPRNQRAGVEKVVRDAGLGRPAPKQLSVRDWFTEGSAELVARRVEVWTLLEWYHHRYVLPNLGIRGVLRRLYLWLRGHKVDGHPIELIAFTSPWQEYRVKAAIRAAMAELERCPIAFLPQGEEEPARCELPTGHEGYHRSGRFEWTDDETSAELHPGPDVPRIEA